MDFPEFRGRVFYVRQGVIVNIHNFLALLAPMKFDWNNPYCDLWRVPLWLEDGNVSAYVANGFVRHYTPETLPSEIKQRLGLIGLAKEHAKLQGEGDVYISPTQVFRPTLYPKDYLGIGWRVSEHIYTVVLPLEVLERMKGKPDDA